MVLPLHKNPNVQSAADRILRKSKVLIVEPLEYLDFVYHMKKSSLILSDSGGVQEEAPYLGKHVLVLRETSERLESVSTGFCHLVGVERDSIVKRAREFLLRSEREDKASLSKPDWKSFPFGSGDAAVKIANILVGSNLGKT